MLALVLVMASWISPGVEVKHRPFLEAVARQAPSPEVAAYLLVWARDESGFGALIHSAYAPCDWGILQIHNRPDLEHNEAGSVGPWLYVLAKAEAACGPSKALAGLASGRCDRGTRLAADRISEARWWLGMASLALR